MQTLLDLDRKLLLWLNGFHHPMLDTPMLYITKTFFWLPLYLFLIFLIFKKYKKDAWYFLIGAVITILLADQITNIMKHFFERLRPSNEPSLVGLVHLVNDYRGGLYGFASGHAANTFGTALFIWLALRPFYRRIGWIFLWAALMTYTRIYLGVHYPGDIIVGALIGLGCGWTGYRVAKWLMAKRKKTISP